MLLGDNKWHQTNSKEKLFYFFNYKSKFYRKKWEIVSMNLPVQICAKCNVMIVFIYITHNILWIVHFWHFPVTKRGVFPLTKQFSATLAGYPTLQLKSDTIYLEIGFH